MMNLRLAPQDAQTLHAISSQLDLNNISETIRLLLREKAAQLHIGNY